MSGDGGPSSSDTAGGIELAPGVFAPASALRIQFARSSGPGGQNVNKLSTKAELWIGLSAMRGLSAAAADRLRLLAGARLTKNDEIHLTGEESRSQAGNRLLVLDRLREMIIRAKVAPKPRKRTKPSKGSQQRRLATKRRRGEVKSLRQQQADD